MREAAEKLKFGQPLHAKVLEALEKRLKMSEQKMSERYTQMSKNEELFQSFIPEKEADAIRRTKRENAGVPDYRTIEIPYSYAVALTAHTYYTSVFCSRNPVFQVSGRHGESEQKTQAIEALLAYQLTVAQMLVQMFIWLLDPAKYGFSVLGHYWDQEIIRVRQKVKVPSTFLGMPIPGKFKEEEQVLDVAGYEGNRMYNCRPQDFFPDTRVPLVHFQKGEFCGRYAETSWNEIYEGQRSFRYFNYDRLKELRDQKGGSQQSGGSITRDEGSSRVVTLPNAESTVFDVPVGFVKGHEVFLKLIPKEWGLADGDRQEIWVFNVSSNSVIFGAMPLGEFSGKFPFDLLLDEIDGYTLFPKSTMERNKPLNDVMTWLINSHFYNVRAAMNNQFVADPSMVVMKDIENPNPGKIIRLKPSAYGKDIRTMLSQLQVMDVTRMNVGDVQTIQGIAERMNGVNDSIMGMLDTGGRKTATEVRTSTSFGVNRLKTQCEWFSATGFTPLCQKLIQRTQQRYSKEKQYRLVGDLAQFSPQFAMVRPEDIAGFFDYEPIDGTLPVDRFAQANLWQMIMGQMKEYPQIMMQYDVAKIFAWVASLAGIKNMAQFRVIPDATMLDQVQAGNVVPISKVKGNLNEPGQVPNVGATG